MICGGQDIGKVKVAAQFFARMIKKLDSSINRIGKTERGTGLRYRKGLVMLAQTVKMMKTYKSTKGQRFGKYIFLNIDNI